MDVVNWTSFNCVLRSQIQIAPFPETVLPVQYRHGLGLNRKINLLLVAPPPSFHPPFSESHFIIKANILALNIAYIQIISSGRRRRRHRGPISPSLIESYPPGRYLLLNRVRGGREVPPPSSIARESVDEVYLNRLVPRFVTPTILYEQ